ncbi:hypothetical protein DPEC_G00103120 [Dallia pectoralis]|uniref:Uncharacterized protein n=1 Tax=Dallia pectoralis TaxID=75939 RepID=A0ACC2GX41_DALPE|nr:hypothetical protein DPEC_G00103120 [Dallia pectoralis]
MRVLHHRADTGRATGRKEQRGRRALSPRRSPSARAVLDLFWSHLGPRVTETKGHFKNTGWVSLHLLGCGSPVTAGKTGLPATGFLFNCILVRGTYESV